MIRLLKDHKTSQIIVAPSKDQFGRSFYVCKRDECIKQLYKNPKYKKSLTKLNDNWWQN